MSLPLDFYQSFLTHGDFADLYLEESKSLSLRWEDGRVEAITESEEAGAGLRYLKDQETRFGNVDLSRPLSGPFTPDEAARLKRIQSSLQEGFPNLRCLPLYLSSTKSHPIQMPLSTLTLDEKIQIMEHAHRVASTGQFVRQVAINYGEKTKKIACLNSLGDCIVEDRTYVVLSLTVTVERNGDLQTAYDAIGGLMGLELFSPHRMEKLASDVMTRAILKLDAPPAPVGPMPVVIASSAGGTLIHEAVGHSLEADAVLDGSSPSYQRKLGKVVGIENLNVYDDPTVPSARGSFYFDDEGMPAEKTLLIENGMLKNYLYDRLSARRGNVTSNGHGRRESYAHHPIPRMSNTYIAPGEDDPKIILSNFKNGLLVTKMGGGQVNTANGDFVFEVEEGFQVREGKRTMVRGATLLGNGPEVLQNIEQIGSDHGWGIGTCGKGGQGVPVADAIPTIRIKSLVIGGTT